MTPNGKHLTDAPLAQWKPGASFDNAKDCEASKLAIQKDADKSILEMHEVVEGINWALCIATDYPHLEGK